MSAYKKLNKQDVYVTSYVAHKSYNAISQSGATNGLQTYGIDTFFAYSSSGDYYLSPFDSVTTLNSNSRNNFLAFRSINQLYYSNFIHGDDKLQSGSFDNYIQSGFSSGSRKIASEASIISIPRAHVGTNIKPGSFVMHVSGAEAFAAYSGSYIEGGTNTDADGDYMVGEYIGEPLTSELLRTGEGREYIDDGEGNLVISASDGLNFTSSIKLGDVIYPHGLVLITSESLTNLINEDLDISWKASHPIYTYNIRCKVKDYEMNFTQNPSSIKSSDGILKDNVTGSSFNPYITTVGLYNDSNELLAVAKLGQPLPKSEDTDMTFVIKLDM